MALDFYVLRMSGRGRAPFCTGWVCDSGIMAKSSITLIKLVEHCGLDEDNLDIEITEDCFHEISRSLSDWRLLAPPLLTGEEVEAIENNNRTEELKRNAFLKRLKQKLSIMATYKMLVCALLKIERGEDARKLCELVKCKGEEDMY